MLARRAAQHQYSHYSRRLLATTAGCGSPPGPSGRLRARWRLPGIYGEATAPHGVSNHMAGTVVELMFGRGTVKAPTPLDVHLVICVSSLQIIATTRCQFIPHLIRRRAG
eukprot:COSAG03_NODE_837_length_5670_cov_7.546222_5_plen_110_part_00